MRFIDVVQSTALALVVAIPAYSADVPVANQLAGEHSSVSTSDGSVRDDVLADHICSAILAHQSGGGTGPSDVKVMVNSCYGGGVLDDIQRIFGPGGACAGIPWVGGSASEAHKPAYGWDDSVVNDPAHAGKLLGSDWTDALAGTDVSPDDSTDGAILQGTGNDTVLSDLTQAGTLDVGGPNGFKLENPQVGSGNGGDAIKWSGGKHEAVVFGGNQTDQRHHNNVNKMTTALNNVWGTDPKNIQTLDGGTSAQLLGAITTAVNNLDLGTQLVIYIDDHGDTHFDVNEFLGSLFSADPISGGIASFNLHEGWFEGLAGNALQGELVFPTLDFEPQSPFNSGDWQFALNGTPLLLPPGPIAGPMQIPIDWELMPPGPNVLEILPVVPGSPPPLLFGHMELNSGPINELDLNDQGFPFGPAQGNGCLPGPGDSLFGNPGGGAPIPEGVASTATHATFQDSNNDGVIQVICEATRPFFAPPAAAMMIDLQTTGDWNSPGNIDLTATYTLSVDEGGAPVVSVETFTGTNNGSFNGAGQSSPFVTGSATNTLRVNGNFQFTGPPGFETDMHLVASLDGFAFPASAVPALAKPWGALALASLLIGASIVAIRRLRGTTPRLLL